MNVDEAPPFILITLLATLEFPTKDGVKVTDT